MKRKSDGTEPTETLSERTMLRMHPSQRARWSRARDKMAAKLGIPVDEAEFLRLAGDDLAKRWGER